MVQRGEQLRLALEARDPIRIGRERFLKDLDGDLAVEPRIVGAVHLAHAAFAQLGHDLVGAEFAADHRQAGTSRHGGSGTIMSKAGEGWPPTAGRHTKS